VSRRVRRHRGFWRVLTLNSAEFDPTSRHLLTIPGQVAGQARPDPLRSRREKAMAVTGYCLKCKDQKEIKDAQAITMKNGKPATTGTCPTCGTKIFKIGKATA
jgi:hypothetical protein